MTFFAALFGVVAVSALVMLVLMQRRHATVVSTLHEQQSDKVTAANKKLAKQVGALGRVIDASEDEIDRLGDLVRKFAPDDLVGDLLDAGDDDVVHTDEDDHENEDH